MKEDSRRLAATTVAVLRVGYGSLMTVAPRRMLRFQTGDDPAGFAVWLARAFGVRDALLGVGVLLAPNEPAERRWVSYGVAADACDCLAAATGTKWLGRRNAVIVTLSAAGATAAGAWSLTGSS